MHYAPQVSQVSTLAFTYAPIPSQDKHLPTAYGLGRGLRFLNPVFTNEEAGCLVNVTMARGWH